MKSKEYYEYKATVMKKFLAKANMDFTRSSSRSGTRVEQPTSSNKKLKNDSRESAYTLSTQVDSEVKSCYQMHELQATSNSVSSYKKYLARAQAFLDEPSPMQRKAVASKNEDGKLPQGIIKVTGKSVLSLM
jgi:hypothetical protein